MSINKTPANTSIKDKDTGLSAKVEAKGTGENALHVITEIGSTGAGASAKDFLYEIQKGDHAKLDVKTFWGTNDDVKNSTEGIWDLGGPFNFLTTASQLDIKSSNVNDIDTTGTGARKVLVKGLDTNWNKLAETVNLNGTTTVTTTASFLRINEMIVMEAGTSRYNEGDITAEVSGTIYECLPELKGQLQSAKFSVPTNNRAYLIRIDFQSDVKDKSKIMDVVVVDNILGVARTPASLFIDSDYALNPAEYITLEEKEDFYINGTMKGAGSVAMSANFALVLEDLT